MHLAAAVILYNPDKFLYERITSYAKGVSKIYIADNSLTCTQLLLEKNDLPIVQYVHNGANEGIAKRLNEICQLALNDGYEWLLMMDQDSAFTPTQFDEYVACVKNYKAIKMVALFGVEYVLNNNLPIGCTPKSVVELITSGSILHLKKYANVGSFNELLFIDDVDIEYCYRCILKGYVLVKFENILLNHQLGKIKKGRSLKTGKLTNRSLHHPTRIYYIVRNYFYVKKHYGKSFLPQMKNRKIALWNRLKNNMLYNKKRGSVLKNIIKGYLHFKTNKMGKR